MVKITNGISVFEVTEGAFDSIYSKQGYVIAGETKAQVERVGKEESKNEKSDDDKFLESIIEKPISQWSKEEVARFVDLNDIDTTGASKLSEVKEIVKNFLAE